MLLLLIAPNSSSKASICEVGMAQNDDRVLLHASAEGRSLYERIGFVTRQMRCVIPVISVMNPQGQHQTRVARYASNVALPENQ